MATFQATDDFFDSLFEVEALHRLAGEASTDTREYSALAKASLLLLIGKFEAFSEAIADEFVYGINEKSPPSEKIPLNLKVNHTNKQIEKLSHSLKSNNYSSIHESLTNLTGLWASTEPAPTICVECRLSYGKHGEEEIRKLFRNIAGVDVFQEIIVVRDVETVSSEKPEQVAIDFRGIFNSIIMMRNNILHEDATPNINFEQISEYVDLVMKFSSKLDDVLRKIINSC